ncbi:MAG: PASTA domain-containing protein [Nocardiopsaceae bacterium]|nr:PASTA domain-containing protein [Nocardiopsaceae bacterium]
MRYAKSVAACALAAASATTVLSTGVARADTVTRMTGSEKACTETNPEYIIADQNETITGIHGTRFTSVAHGPRYDSAYLVTGYSRGNNSDSLCGHWGDDSFELPLKASSGARISGHMSYSRSRNSVRPGWDIWLVPAGAEYKDTSAGTMERNSRTVEVMVEPGRPGHVYNIGTQPGWHRAYIGARLGNADLAARVDEALARFRLRRSQYYWEAIDGGSEAPGGTFRMRSYSLDITERATATESATKSATYTATSGGVSATATAKGHARLTRTAVVPVKPGHPAPLAAARAKARKAAGSLALSYARHNAKVLAERDLLRKLGEARVPDVRGLRATVAVSRLRSAGLDPSVTLVRGKVLLVTGTSPAIGDVVKLGTKVVLHCKVKR